MFRAGTGRNGTFTHVESIFFTVRSSDVATAGYARFTAGPPIASAPAVALFIRFRRVNFVFIAASSLESSTATRLSSALGVQDEAARIRAFAEGAPKPVACW